MMMAAIPSLPLSSCSLHKNDLLRKAYRGLLKCHSRVSSSITQILGLVCENSLGTNTLAYFGPPSFTEKNYPINICGLYCKCFMVVIYNHS